MVFIRQPRVNLDQMKSDTQPLPHVNFLNTLFIGPMTLNLLLQSSLPFPSVNTASLLQQPASSRSTHSLEMVLFSAKSNSVLDSSERRRVPVCACSLSRALWKLHLRAAPRPLTSKGWLLRSTNLISITLSTVPLDRPSGGTLT